MIEYGIRDENDIKTAFFGQFMDGFLLTPIENRVSIVIITLLKSVVIIISMDELRNI